MSVPILFVFLQVKHHEVRKSFGKIIPVTGKCWFIEAAQNSLNLTRGVFVSLQPFWFESHLQVSVICCDVPVATSLGVWRHQRWKNHHGVGFQAANLFRENLANLRKKNWNRTFVHGEYEGFRRFTIQFLVASYLVFLSQLKGLLWTKLPPGNPCLGKNLGWFYCWWFRNPAVVSPWYMFNLHDLQGYVWQLGPFEKRDIRIHFRGSNFMFFLPACRFLE